MLKILRSRWLWAIVLWTGAAAVVLWALSEPFTRPCNRVWDADPDPSLPLCPFEVPAGYGVLVYGLIVIWLTGAVIWAVALIGSLVARRRNRGVLR
jgi:hypothetical protein